MSVLRISREQTEQGSVSTMIGGRVRALRIASSETSAGGTCVRFFNNSVRKDIGKNHKCHTVKIVRLFNWSDSREKRPKKERPDFVSKLFIFCETQLLKALAF